MWRRQEPPVSGGDLVGDVAGDPRASLTERARVEASRRVGQDSHSVAQVAAAFGVAWATVITAAVVEHEQTQLVDGPDRLAGVRALGVDETAFLAGERQTGSSPLGV